MASSLPFLSKKSTEGFHRRLECEARSESDDRHEDNGDSHEDREEGRQIDRLDRLDNGERGKWHARPPADGFLVARAEWMGSGSHAQGVPSFPTPELVQSRDGAIPLV